MNALLKILESLARTFTDHRFDVKIRESSKRVFHIHGDTIYVAYPDFDLSEEEKLRLIVDALNHECEHINLGFTKQKLEDFVRRTRLGSLARWVLTIVEDHYTDFSRLKRWRGLKKARALYAKVVMERLPSVATLPDRPAALLGLYMISYSGYAKGEEARPELRGFFEEVRRTLVDLRNVHEYAEREAIAERILMKIARLKPLDYTPPDLDWKIDFQIACGSAAGLETSLREEVDIARIMEWNDVDDLSPSGFERAIIESVRQLEPEIEKFERMMKTVAARDGRIDPTRKPEVPESVMKEVLQLLEKIKTEELFIESEWGEEINVRNYLRYACGENCTSLYYATRPSDTGGRAILIALDLSGSMKDKIEETVKACHIVAAAAEILNDKVAAFGFQEKSGAVRYTKIVPIKLWHEKYRPEFFTGLDVGGNTPLLEAVVEAGEWLKDVAARRKIAMIFTDAEPTTSSPEDVYRAVCRIGNVVGVGVGTKINPEMLRSCFGNSYIWAPEIDDLPRLLFQAYLSFVDAPLQEIL